MVDLYLYFVLTQKEESVLQHILSVLGLGTVRKTDNNGIIVYRQVVENFTGILLLATIFNGNLVIPNRQEQLGKWLFDLNRKLVTPGSRIYGLCSTIVISPCLFKPSLKDAWLSGFTDATLMDPRRRGTFNVNITKRVNTVTGYRVQLRY